MCQVKAASLLPIEPEFVLVPSGGNVRVPARLHIRIDANGNRRHPRAAPLLLCGLLQQRIQFRFRFDIEKQNSRANSAPARSINERLANFFTRLAHAGKNDAVPAYAEAPQVLQLAARDDIESAAQLRQMLE